MTQKLHITDLETALLAATDLAKRQCARADESEQLSAIMMAERDMARARIEELEAERDAGPVARWTSRTPEVHRLYWGHLCLGEIFSGTGKDWWATHRTANRLDALTADSAFPTPEAAKAAVEEALRGLSAKTEGV